MARSFASSTEFLTFSPGGLTALTSRVFTVVAVIRLPSANRSIFSLANASNADQMFWIADATKLWGQDDFGSGLAVAQNVWGIAAISHNTGTGAWWHSWKPLGGSWSHGTSGSVVSTLGAWTQVRVGKTSINTAGVDLAAMAVYQGYKTDAEVEALATQNMADWMAGSPLAAWQFNQAAVTDTVTDLTAGGADQLSRTGTAVIAEPAGWTYYTPTPPASRFVRSGGVWVPVTRNVRQGGAWVAV